MPRSFSQARRRPGPGGGVAGAAAALSLALLAGCLPFDGICDTTADCAAGQVCGPDGLCVGTSGDDGGTPDGGGEAAPEIRSIEITPDRASRRMGHNELAIAVTLDRPGTVEVDVEGHPADCGQASPQQSWACSYVVTSSDGEGVQTVTATAQGPTGTAGAPATASVFFDFTGPTVDQVAPGRDEAGVPRNATLEVDFSEPVAPASAAGAVSLVPEGKPAAPGTSALSEDGTHLTFTPSAWLLANRKHFVTVDPVADLVGNPMETAYAWSFVTGVSPPEIQSVSPEDGTRPHLSRAVSATFTLEMAESTASDGWFTVSCNGSPVDAQGPTWDASHTVATLRMLGFEPGSCTATILPGVRDTHGVALAEGRTWSFDTRFRTDTVATNVVSEAAEDGHVALALDPGGVPWVAYLTPKQPLGRALHLAHRESPGSWKDEEVPDVDWTHAPQELGAHAVQVDPEGKVHLFFPLGTKVHHYDASNAADETVAAYPVGTDVSHVSGMHDGSDLLVTYATADLQARRLRFAVGGSGSWTLRDLRTNDLSSRAIFLTSVFADGAIQSFYSTSGTAAWLSNQNGSQKELLVPVPRTYGDVAAHRSTLHVAFSDPDAGVVRHAVVDLANAKLDQIHDIPSDVLGGDPVHVCMAVDADGHVHLAWFEPDANGPYLAYANDVDGDWLVTQVDAGTGVVGRSCSIALDGDRPVVAYTFESTQPGSNQIRLAY